MKGKNWKAKGIKKGALHDYLMSAFGEKAFTNRGTIKKSVLRDIADGKKIWGVQPNLTTRRRAQYAINRMKRS